MHRWGSKGGLKVENLESVLQEEGGGGGRGGEGGGGEGGRGGEGGGGGGGGGGEGRGGGGGGALPQSPLEQHDPSCLYWPKMCGDHVLSSSPTHQCSGTFTS